MAGNTRESASIHLYDPITAKWQERATVADLPTVIMADVFWGEREGAYSKPSGFNARFMNPNYQNFDWSYFHTEVQQRLVWCPEHLRFEEIHHLESADSIKSVDGCRMQGKMAYFSVNIDRTYKENTIKTVTVPVSWNLERSADGSVDIRADILRIPISMDLTENTILPATKNIESGLLTIGETFRLGEKQGSFSPCGKNWSDFGIDIPTNITEQAISYLLETAGREAYIPPDSNTNGYRKLRAFVRRPEDLHVEYWREIIGDEFSALFPRRKNSFVALCKYLGLQPTASLTAGYEKNPFAPLWAALLREWGFKEEKNIAMFYELEDIAGIWPRQFAISGTKVAFHRYYEMVMIESSTGTVRYSDENDGKDAFTCAEVQGYLAENIMAARLDRIHDYVTWALTQTNEEHVVGRSLWGLATKPWTQEVYDELADILYLNDDEYLSAAERTLSPKAKQHLLNFHRNWYDRHWLRAHEQTLQELEKISDLWGERDSAKMEARWSDEEDFSYEEMEESPDLCRTIRLLTVYEKLLRGQVICAKDYDVSTMLGRDMRVIRKVEPALSYRPPDGNYKILNREKKYKAKESIAPLGDRSRKARLLAYLRFLWDVGFITKQIANEIAGKEIPRRTFVRDLRILRRAFPEKALVYHAKDKRYVWEEVEENESH